MNLDDGAEHGEVVYSGNPFRLVPLQRLLGDEHFFIEGVLRRIMRQELDLSYEVIPYNVTHDLNDRRTLLDKRW